MIKFLTLQKSGDNENAVTLIGTTENVDRDGDIVRVAGMDTKNYEANPVIMFAHNWRDYPVARAISVKKEDNRLIIVPKFAETHEGAKTKYLVEKGFLSTVSLGFVPKKVFHADEFDHIKALDTKWYNANKSKLNQARRVIWEAELMEVSFVPIPANPSARVVMEGKGLTVCAFSAPTVTAENDYDDVLIELPAEEKASVPYKDTTIDMESKWNARDAIKKLREWAGGENIDMSKYRQGFAWYDRENADNLTAYKLPHHTVVDGELVAVWRGVVAAMAALLGSRGGVDIPSDERRAVYNHLAKHYKAAEKEPPKFKEWAPDEVLATWDDEHKEAYFAAWNTKDWLDYVAEKAAKQRERLDEYVAQLERKEARIAELEKIVAKSDEQTPKNEPAGVVYEVDGVTSEELTALMNDVTVKLFANLHSEKGE